MVSAANTQNAVNTNTANTSNTNASKGKAREKLKDLEVGNQMKIFC